MPLTHEISLSETSSPELVKPHLSTPSGRRLINRDSFVTTTFQEEPTPRRGVYNPDRHVHEERKQQQEQQQQQQQQQEESLKVPLMMRRRLGPSTPVIHTIHTAVTANEEETETPSANPKHRQYSFRHGNNNSHNSSHNTSQVHYHRHPYHQPYQNSELLLSQGQEQEQQQYLDDPYNATQTQMQQLCLHNEYNAYMSFSSECDAQQQQQLMRESHSQGAVPGPVYSPSASKRSLSTPRNKNIHANGSGNGSRSGSMAIPLPRTVQQRLHQRTSRDITAFPAGQAPEAPIAPLPPAEPLQTVECVPEGVPVVADHHYADHHHAMDMPPLPVDVTVRGENREWLAFRHLVPLDRNSASATATTMTSSANICEPITHALYTVNVVPVPGMLSTTNNNTTQPNKNKKRSFAALPREEIVAVSLDDPSQWECIGRTDPAYDEEHGTTVPPGNRWEIPSVVTESEQGDEKAKEPQHTPAGPMEYNELLRVVLGRYTRMYRVAMEVTEHCDTDVAALRSGLPPGGHTDITEMPPTESTTITPMQQLSLSERLHREVSTGLMSAMPDGCSLYAVTSRPSTSTTTTTTKKEQMLECVVPRGAVPLHSLSTEQLMQCAEVVFAEGQQTHSHTAVSNSTWRPIVRTVVFYVLGRIVPVSMGPHILNAVRRASAQLSVPPPLPPLMQWLLGDVFRCEDLTFTLRGRHLHSLSAQPDLSPVSASTCVSPLTPNESTVGKDSTQNQNTNKDKPPTPIDTVDPATVTPVGQAPPSGAELAQMLHAQTKERHRLAKQPLKHHRHNTLLHTSGHDSSTNDSRSRTPELMGLPFCRGGVALFAEAIFASTEPSHTPVHITTATPVEESRATSCISPTAMEVRTLVNSSTSASSQEQACTVTKVSPKIQCAAPPKELDTETAEEKTIGTEEETVVAPTEKVKAVRASTKVVSSNKKAAASNNNKTTNNNNKKTNSASKQPAATKRSVDNKKTAPKPVKKAAPTPAEKEAEELRLLEAAMAEAELLRRATEVKQQCALLQRRYEDPRMDTEQRRIARIETLALAQQWHTTLRPQVQELLQQKQAEIKKQQQQQQQQGKKKGTAPSSTLTTSVTALEKVLRPDVFVERAVRRMEDGDWDHARDSLSEGLHTALLQQDELRVLNPLLSEQEQSDNEDEGCNLCVSHCHQQQEQHHHHQKKTREELIAALQHRRQAMRAPGQSKSTLRVNRALQKHRVTTSTTTTTINNNNNNNHNMISASRGINNTAGSSEYCEEESDSEDSDTARDDTSTVAGTCCLEGNTLNDQLMRQHASALKQQCVALDIQKDQRNRQRDFLSEYVNSLAASVTNNTTNNNSNYSTCKNNNYYSTAAATAEHFTQGPMPLADPKALEQLLSDDATMLNDFACRLQRSESE